MTICGLCSNHHLQGESCPLEVADAIRFHSNPANRRWIKNLRPPRLEAPMNRSDGPNNDTDDIGNLHWRSITRQSHTVKDAGGSFIATDTVTGKRYLVNWSSFDAALAQDALRRLATLSAVKGPTA